jgi:hypothetical protein
LALDKKVKKVYNMQIVPVVREKPFNYFLEGKMKIVSFLSAPVLALVTFLTWHLPGAKRARQEEARQVAELQVSYGDVPGQVLASPPQPPPRSNRGFIEPEPAFIAMSGSQTF